MHFGRRFERTAHIWVKPINRHTHHIVGSVPIQRLAVAVARSAKQLPEKVLYGVDYRRQAAGEGRRARGWNGACERCPRDGRARIRAGWAVAGPRKGLLEPPVRSVGRGARSVFRNQPLVTQMSELLTQRAQHIKP